MRSMIVNLAEAEIEEFLRAQVVGRIGCHADGSTYVVPVIYVWDGDCVYVQSIEGRKIDMMRRNPDVCFEVDEYHADGSWRSVIIDGVYEELDGGLAEEALALLMRRFGRRRGAADDRSRPSGAGPRPVCFRIRCLEITGRKVSRGGEARAVQRLGLAAARRAARRGVQTDT